MSSSSYGSEAGPAGGPEFSAVTPSEDLRTVMINKVAWGAVFAGMVIAVVTQLFINLVGVGVGAATIDVPGGSSPAASSLSIGAGVWFIVSAIIAALIGGYAAGRLSGKPDRSTAAWHGLTTWALTTLTVVYLLTSAAGTVLGGASSMLSSAMGGVTSAIGSTAQTAAQAAAPSVAGMADPMASIRDSVQSASGGNDPASLRDAAFSAVRGVLTGDPAQAEQGRARAAEAIAKAQGIPVEDARRQVQQYEDQYRQATERAKQQATDAADVAAKTASRGALFAALSLVFGALAGWFGGRMGAVRPTITGARW